MADERYHRHAHTRGRPTYCRLPTDFTVDQIDDIGHGHDVPTFVVVAARTIGMTR
jgi:hypothetical protein